MTKYPNTQRIPNIKCRKARNAACFRSGFVIRHSLGIWVFGFFVITLLSRITATSAPIPEPLRTTTFVAFDVETTGLSAAKHRVIEIAAVKVQEGRIVARQAWLINPGRPIPPGATRVHGLTDRDVAEAPSFREVYPEFLAFVKDTILVAHNAPFDVRFMAHEIHRNALSFPSQPVLDNLQLARTWFPELESHRLKALAEHLEITLGRHHRALDDSVTLAHVFMHGLGLHAADSTLSNLVASAGGPLYIEVAVPLDRAPAKTAR